MIADLKPYAEYKESGLPWLGKVPGHWDVRRLKSHLLRNDAGVWGTTFDERGTAVLRSTEQSVDGGWRIVNPARLLLSESQKKAALLHVGDLVVTKSSGSALHIGKTSLVTQHVAEMECCFSNFMQRLRVSHHVSPTFAWILLNSRVGREQFVYQSTTTTGLGNLNGTILGNCTFSFPPPDEQAAIVRFLDWANGRLERAIRAKRKVIALLNEQKQAIIHRAVTRGLDPSVPLKPSGISWLGDIPGHWEVVRSRRLFTARKELARPNDVQLSATQAYGVIPQDEFERRVGRRVVKISMHLDKRKHVERDDFVMSMRSFQGGLERAWAKGAIRSSYVILRPSDSVVVDFFTYVLKSRGYIGALQCTADFIRDGQDLTEANFREVDLPLPPRTEQAQIAEHIEQATSRLIDDASRLEREIELLREYRTRLVADVVTGKLDVREAAARLPDEAPLAIAEDDADLSDEIEAADEEVAE